MTSEENILLLTIFDGKKDIQINKDDIEQLGALRYTPQEVAQYFDIPLEIVEQELNRKDSQLDYYLQRGKLVFDTKEQMQLLNGASSGNTTASERLEKIRRNKDFEISKTDIFGSFRSEVKFNKLSEYLLSGGTIDLSNEEALYLDALRLIDSLERQYGRRKTIHFLQKKPFNLSYNKAREMMDEATNIFYGNKNIEKKALRFKYAEMLEEMAILAKQNAKTNRDLEVAGELIAKAAKMQELDKEDLPVLPREVYQPAVRIFTLDPERVGIPGINRNELAAQIEELNISELTKKRLRYDAMIDDVLPLTEMLDEQPSKD